MLFVCLYNFSSNYTIVSLRTVFFLAMLRKDGGCSPPPTLHLSYRLTIFEISTTIKKEYVMMVWHKLENFQKCPR